jgi:GABA permease
MWFFPWASWLAIAGMLAVLAAMALTPGLASQFYVSVAALAVALMAYGLSAWRRRRRASAR